MNPLRRNLSIVGLLAIIVCSAVFIANKLTFRGNIAAIPPRTQLAQVASSLEGPGSGLVGWWKLDDGSGTTAADSSGNGNAGALQGSPLPAWTAGQVGGALSFNGTGWVTIPDSPTTRFSGSFSASAWVDIASYPSSYYVIISKLQPGGSTYTYRVMINSSGKVVVQMFDASEVLFANVTTAGTINRNSWNNIVVSLSANQVGGVSVYINGAAETLSGTNNAGAPGGLAGQPTYLGKEVWNSADYYYLAGSLDDVRLYDRALSAAEAGQLYGGGSGSPAAPSSSDTTPPTSPANLVAASVSYSRIDLSWTASSDNVGVAGYYVYRNGAEIGSTPGLSYADGGLAGNTSYSYRVAAYDAAGNISAQSAPASVTTAPFVVQASGDIYIAQTSQGNDSGSDCADAHSVSWFNAVSNWGAGAGQIGPGTTAHLCGVISSALTVLSGGAAGSPVTIVFEPGAKLSAPYWTSAGAISDSGHGYITIDGGADGVIEATANGSALANQVAGSIGVYVADANNIEIKNLRISNLYVRTAGSDPTQSGVGIDIYGQVSNISVHNNAVTNAEEGIVLAFSGGGSAVIYNNTVSLSSTGIIVGSTGTNAAYAGASIYGNDLSDTYNWDGNWTTSAGGTDWNHHDGIHVWAIQTGTAISGLEIYDNKIHGNFGNQTTSCVYVEAGFGVISQPLIFDNVIYALSPSKLAVAFIDVKRTTGAGIYNNTVAYWNSSLGNGISSDTSTGTLVYNNIFESGDGFYLGGSPAEIPTSDHNDFFGTTVMYYNNAINYISNWNSYSGQDKDSLFTDPLFVDAANNDYRLTAPSPAIGAGVNLTAYCASAAALCKDYAGTSRPATGPWDIGAYQYAATGAVSVPAAPPAPAPVSGSCGAAVNTCAAGAFAGQPDTSASHLWQCLGSNGGTTASCSLPIASASNPASLPDSAPPPSAPAGGGGVPASESSPVQPAQSPALLPAALPPIPALYLSLAPFSYSPYARDLQIFLNDHGYAVAASGAGSKGRETSYYGYLTQAALKRYASAYAAQAPAAAQPLQPACPQGFVCAPIAKGRGYVFTRSLAIGSVGEDVRQLQIFLNSHGFQVSSSGPGSPGRETFYFGILTKQALIRYQDAHAATIIVPLGLASGTGYFGPYTMKEINALDQ